MPRHPLQVALFAVASVLAGVLFAALLASALVLRFGSLSSTGLLSAHVYNVIFTIHSSFAPALVNAMQLVLLAVVAPLDAHERVRTVLYLATVALIGSQALGLAALSAVQAPESLGYAAGLIPSAVVAMCLMAAVLQWRRLARPTVAVLVISALAAVAFPAARDELSFLLCVIALSRKRPTTATSVVLALSALFTLRELSEWGSALWSLLWFFGASWLVASTWRVASLHDQAGTRWAVRSGLIAFGTALLLHLFLSVVSIDVHLHDTLFIVAAYHARELGLMLLVVAVVLGEIPAGADVVAPSGWARLGVLTWLLGSLGFVWAFASLGARGMPRRYIAYLPELSGMHLAASIAVVILAAGALMTALAAIRSLVASGSRDGAKSSETP